MKKEANHPSTFTNGIDERNETKVIKLWIPITSNSDLNSLKNDGMVVISYCFRICVSD